jgi:cytochrome b561
MFDRSTVCDPSAPAYDHLTVVLHWLTALLVVSLWSVGQTIDWFPKGVPRTTARSMHILFGALLSLVLAYRIGWRATGGRRLPKADRGALQVLATTTHVALYVLLVSTVLLGLTNAWVRGDSLFGVWTIPAFDPSNRGLRETIEEIHGLSANVLLGVAAFHAAAALVHHYVWKDRLVRRMSWR